MIKIQKALLCFLFLTILTGCAKKMDDQTLKLRIGGEPSVINPILSTDSASSSIESLIFNGLMKVNPDLEIVPDLAKSYKISPDGKTYTFYLRTDVHWHNGVKFTAQDVKFTFDKILEKTTNTVRRSNFIIDGEPIQFKVVNNYIIQAVLPKPFAPFLTRMTMGILPEHLLKEKDINTSEFNRIPIGTGPFEFVTWKTGHYIYLKRNSKYFDKTPKLEGILIKMIPDSNTALVALKRGEIDLATIPSHAFRSYKFDPSIRVFHYPDLSYSYMGLNLKNPFLADKKVRQALAHAINKKILIQNVLKGLGTIAYLPTSPLLWAYPKDAHEIYEYNPEKSKQLLSKAGFVRDKRTNILHKNGKPFEFTLITNKGNKDREKIAQIIQRYLQEIGIKMNIQVMEWSSFVRLLNSPKDPKPFDAALLAWSLSLDPDSYSIWHSSQYPNGFNLVGYKNAKVDKLLEKGRLEMDQTSRARIYKSLFTKIAKDVPYVFLFYPEAIVATHRRVKGLSKPGPAGMLNPIENVYLLQEKTAGESKLEKQIREAEEQAKAKIPSPSK
ncbi:peptide-binding protein [Candidatus Margulisiibacteriota bacterium]